MCWSGTKAHRNACWMLCRAEKWLPCCLRKLRKPAFWGQNYMAHSKNYQVHNVSHDKRTSSLHEKEKPMDTSEPANPQTIKQLCEITGVPYDAALNAFKAAHGDVEKALTFLTNPGNDKEMQDGSNQKAIQTSVVKNSSVKQDEVIDLTKDGNDRDEDLEKAIALSLQESHPSAPQGITAEEQDISRVLEASLNESKSSLKRKRGDPWMTFVDPVNPYERKRTEGTPVGFKNVGNTCWFSAVIQSLFHLPVFRKLVLNCELPAIENKESKDVTRLSFMHELRKLFALLIGSKRKYVDPTKAVEILKEALQYNGSESNPGNQQDVSEFTHKLLEWLEDTFKVETCAASSQSTNPVMELFFGQSKVEGVYEGKQFSNLEMFGAYPVQVQAYNNLYDSLEGGMARGRIEPANNVNTHQSDQEHWFTRLPAVLKFMLSRFHFNQATGRAEKIHERLNFDRVVYMDRYMETNKDIIRIRREEVKKLKEHRHLLKKSLESFTNYGSRHTHIKDILDSSLQFLRATSPLRDNGDVEMESDSTPSSPRSVGASTKAGLLAESRLASLRPAPRYVTESELVMTESCLTRWRKEVEQDVHDISKKISDVEQAISLMYDDDGMKKVPYRLHAVLVHEGQASGGHYWAYIYDPQEQQWRKFNDITVSEVTWEEVQKESLGGYRNVSAYGLMYVDASREGLVQASDTLDVVPSDLQDIVNEDNEKFEKEMVEWDEKKASPSPEDKTKMASTRSDLGLDSEASCAVSPYDQAPMIKITKATTDDDLDKVLSQMCGNETERVHQISRDHPPEGPRDVRLENIGIYLLRCGAPSEVIQWQILKQVNENMNNKADPSYGPLSKRATSHLSKEALGKLDVFDKWEEKYVVFQRVNSCFLTGLEHFHNQKFQEALPYLVHAYNLNHKLEDPDHPPQSMDENLLAYCRRICFLKVNDHALRLFESHSSVSKGLDLVGDLIVPCIPILMSSPHNDDREAVETMRQNWFGYLGSDIDDQRQKKLEDLLPLLTSDGHQEMRPPPIVRPTSSRDLCERFKKAMELVHANMAFSAKA